MAVNFAFFFFLLLEVIFFYHQYMTHTSSFKSLFKNDGVREAVFHVIKNKSHYKKVYMPSGNLSLYYLFFSKDLSPKYIGKYHDDLRIDSIDTITFINKECLTDQSNHISYAKNSLIIENGDCLPNPGFKQLTTIIRKDSTTAFRILTL